MRLLMYNKCLFLTTGKPLIYLRFLKFYNYTPTKATEVFDFGGFFCADPALTISGF